MRIFLILLFFLIGCKEKTSDKTKAVLTEPKTVFEGSSEKLQETDIVGVLDSEIKPGSNLIWCSALISAWKEIEKNITKEEPLLTEKSNLVDSLNSAPDPSEYVPGKATFSAAGLVKDGIEDRIKNGLNEKFPNKALPQFVAPTPNSLIAYAYLKAGITFTHPYSINKKAMNFTDSTGTSSKVKTFGIFDRDTYIDNVADQIAVLYAKGSGDNKQFIVDLDKKSKEYQILLATIKPQKSLKATVSYINDKLETDLSRLFSRGNTLIVPQTAWKVIHSYSELVSKKFSNKDLDEYSITKVQQDIEFKLHSKGAEVESEAILEAVKSADFDKVTFDGRYNFDQPFYILMRKRGEKHPFFLMYVDNAELLSKWE